MQRLVIRAACIVSALPKARQRKCPLLFRGYLRCSNAGRPGRPRAMQLIGYGSPGAATARHRAMHGFLVFSGQSASNALGWRRNLNSQDTRLRIASPLILPQPPLESMPAACFRRSRRRFGRCRGGCVRCPEHRLRRPHTRPEPLSGPAVFPCHGSGRQGQWTRRSAHRRPQQQLDRRRNTESGLLRAAARTASGPLGPAS